VLFDPEGRMQKQGTFRENLLEGPVTEYASDGKTVELLWQFSKGEAITLNGAPLIARPWDGVATEIRRLEGLQKFEGDPFQTPWSLKPLQAGALKPEYLQAALYHLEIYRLLAGLPYKALTLNEEYNREAQHGAVMLEIIDRLDHTPPQPPGMPDDFYQIAYTGTSHSNLAASGGPSMTCFKQVDLYMEDSDTRNLRTLGHRRWVMDPHAGQFGFGMGAHYGALRVMDGSSRETVEWDLLAWPPRGCLPVNYFGRDWAWSVSLNPARFTLPDKHETIEYGITPLDEHAQPSGPPLTLNASLVGKFANLDPTLILRPSNFDLTPNTRYLVKIRLGAQDPDTKIIAYVVAFMPPVPAAAPEPPTAVPATPPAVPATNPVAEKPPQIPPQPATPAHVPIVAPETPEAFLEAVAALPAEDQAKRVIAKLQELNPQMDARKLDYALDTAKQNVIRFALSPQGKFERQPVKTIWPLKAFTKLENLSLASSDVEDLEPIAGLPLTKLFIAQTQVTSLTPLKNTTTLTTLDIGATRITDLAPLHGLPLRSLFCSRSTVFDVTPLQGLPLHWLDLRGTLVADFRPLRTLPLEGIFCDYKPAWAADLKAIATLKTINDKQAVDVVGPPEP
jgi:hypothetical protein